MSQDQHTAEQGPSGALSAPVSASDPGVGASRRPDPLSGPQTGAESFDDGPYRLSDADLVAWAVVLEHRRRQLRDGITIPLLPFPPCPTCRQPVHEAATAEDFGQGRLTVQSCGHAHTFAVSDVYRLTGHIDAMLDNLEAADRMPAGEGRVTTADIIREAAARTTPDNPATSGDTADNPLRQRIARAIHRYDNKHALCGNDIASQHHLGEADAVLAELRRELDALAEYENTINWHTTCTSCARILDSAHRETERAEKAEDAIGRVQDAAALHQKHLISTTELYAVIGAALQPPAPARDAGPSVAECAEADARWWGGEKAGER